MKYIFLILVWAVSFGFFSTIPASAADSEELTNTETVTELSLIAIEPTDDRHLLVTFSEEVDMKTLKLSIQKQSDNSTLKFVSLDPVTDRAGVVEMFLENSLEEGSAYTLTVVSAVGISGSVIRDGALAIKDFITPIPLKKYEEVLNAPANPGAVMVDTGAANVVTVTPVETPEVVEPPKVMPPKVTTPPETVVAPAELPLTGMNPLFMLVLILPLVLLFMRKKA